MVEGRVYTVDSNSIDTKLLQEWQVSRTSITVRQRVDEVRRLEERVIRVSRDGSYMNDEGNREFEYKESMRPGYGPCSWYAIPLMKNLFPSSV